MQNYSKHDDGDYKVIYSLNLVNYLVRCGHDIIKADDNENDSRLKVFMFLDTPQLQSDIHEFTIKNQRKGRK